MSFAPADALVEFVIIRPSSIVRIDTIHAFGPALIERVVFNAMDVVYDKFDKPTSPEDEGKLFVCPRKVLARAIPLHVYIRCLPALFMLDRTIEQAEASEEMALPTGHNSEQCDDCADFRRLTGLES